MARYVRWLVERSGIEIVDPWSGRSRRIGYGDVGVLAITTTNLPTLFEAFDRDAVPYAMRGGTLFLGDPVQRRFLLGLCALADRDDGVANAALLRPPFFAVDLGELARSRADDPGDPAVRARAAVSELRRRRFERSPGATARALLDETGFGRMVALGANGTQRLGGLRELCFQLDARALAEQLDFDAVVERIRAWVHEPAQLDRPHSVSGEVVRVLTVHQAKGLEFPVVVLWDARAVWNERTTYEPWTVERAGGGWAMRLDGLCWEEPEGLAVAEHEREMREAERKRLVYVAATRARDVLVLPDARPREPRWILGRLLGAGRPPAVLEHAVHADDEPAAWFTEATPPSPAAPTDLTDVDRERAVVWESRVAEVARRRAYPEAFTDAASPRWLWGKRGRFGTAFGETVHLAIGRALVARVTVAEAVMEAVARTRLAAHHAEAEEDVSRALEALEAIGVASGGAFELEYPVAGTSGSGALVAGYADLVASMAASMIVIDFKTDAPPVDASEIAGRYIAQVGGYAAVLASAFDCPVRAALLFTANGSVYWL